MIGEFGLRMAGGDGIGAGSSFVLAKLAFLFKGEDICIGAL